MWRNKIHIDKHYAPTYKPIWQPNIHTQRLHINSSHRQASKHCYHTTVDHAVQKMSQCDLRPIECLV